MSEVLSKRYKPEVRAHRCDYEIRLVSHQDAAQLIVKYHYAKGCSKTSTDRFGLFRDGVMVGAALWLPPTKPCAQSVDREDWRRVVALSRFVIAPGEPTNAASIFLGSILRTMKRDGRWVAAVTFADFSQGHEGTIYKATNWQYVGVTKPKVRWLDADGKQVALLATKSRTVSQMEALGYVRSGAYAKHKYIYRFS